MHRRIDCGRRSRLGFALGALLLAGPSLAASVGGAQAVASAVGAPTSSPSARSPTDDLEEQAATRVAAAVCSKRVVLLGELPEHGEARGFGVKAGSSSASSRAAVSALTHVAPGSGLSWPRRDLRFCDLATTSDDPKLFEPTPYGFFQRRVDCHWSRSTW